MALIEMDFVKGGGGGGDINPHTRNRITECKSYRNNKRRYHHIAW